jgi:integration host factor subunit beta
LSVSKSDLIKELKIIYPNLLKKDLLKIFDIFLDEIKSALKNNERVELRGWGIFYQKSQKSRNSRNPKTGEKIFTPEKKSINFKMSKELFEAINEK